MDDSSHDAPMVLEGTALHEDYEYYNIPGTGTPAGGGTGAAKPMGIPQHPCHMYANQQAVDTQGDSAMESDNDSSHQRDAPASAHAHNIQYGHGEYPQTNEYAPNQLHTDPSSQPQQLQTGNSYGGAHQAHSPYGVRTSQSHPHAMQRQTTHPYSQHPHTQHHASSLHSHSPSWSVHQTHFRFPSNASNNTPSHSYSHSVGGASYGASPSIGLPHDGQAPGGPDANSNSQPVYNQPSTLSSSYGQTQTQTQTQPQQHMYQQQQQQQQQQQHTGSFGTSFGPHSLQNLPLTSQYSTSSFFSQGPSQTHQHQPGVPRMGQHSLPHTTNLPSSISSSYKSAVSLESTTPTATYPVPFSSQSYGSSHLPSASHPHHGHPPHSYDTQHHPAQHHPAQHPPAQQPPTQHHPAQPPTPNSSSNATSGPGFFAATTPTPTQPSEISVPSTTPTFTRGPAPSQSPSGSNTNQFSAAKLAIARNNNKRSLLSSKLAQQQASPSPMMPRPSMASADVTMTKATPTSYPSQATDPAQVQYQDHSHLAHHDNNSTNHEHDQSQSQSQPHTDPKAAHLDIANHPIPDVLLMLTALLQKIIDANDALTDTNHTAASASTSGSNSLNNLHPAAGESVSHSTTSSSSFPPHHATLEDEAFMSPTKTSLLAFHGRNVPAISLDAYLNRILKYCPTTNEVFISLLVYFDRIAHRINSNDVTLSQAAGSSPNVSMSTSSAHVGSQGSSTPTKLPLFVIDSYNIHRLIIAGVTVASKFFSDIFYKNSRYAKVGGLPLEELNHLELQFLILTEFELMISLDEMQRYADLLLRFWQKHESAPDHHHQHNHGAPTQPAAH